MGQRNRDISTKKTYTWLINTWKDAQHHPLFRSVRLVSQSCPTVCNPIDCTNQTSLSITNSQSLFKLMSIESVMLANHLILCRPLLLPSISPSLHSVPVSQFSSGGQSIGASASTSVLPMNIQDWFPIGLTGWIFLQSKGLSRVFYNTTVQKHQFFGAQISLWSNSHIHTWLHEKP